MNKNEIINDILREAYKAVPKKVVLNGNNLIEIHNEIGNILDKYAGKKPDVDELTENFIQTFFYPYAKGEDEETSMRTFVKNWLNEQIKQGKL